tara:strand:+ start:368 stop:586 length:219 start_codon:yes stop_codon:yes gene_type:complete
LPASNPFSDAIAAVTQEYERLSDDADKKKTPPMQGRKVSAPRASTLSNFMQQKRITPPSDKRLKNFRQRYVT